MKGAAMKREIKKGNDIISFFLPLVILCILGVSKGYVSGKASILESDVAGQYIEYLSYFRSIAFSKNNLFYSLTYGIGGSIYGLWAYYLASPLNILVFLFRSESLPFVFIVIVLIKIAFASLNMNLYLRRVYGAQTFSWLFAAAYGLCGYVIGYYYNLMWMDGVALLPLVMQGLHKMLKEERYPLRYIVFLALTIITNYYIAWMICIFLFLYFCYELLTSGLEKKNVYRKIKRFCLYSCLSAGIAAIVIIPVLFVAKESSKQLKIPPFAFEINYSVAEFIKQFFSITARIDRTVGLPNVFCGSLVFLLFLLQYVLREGKRKAGKFILFMILMLSGMVQYTNLFWHGLNYNISYPYRYSFVTCFFVIESAYAVWRVMCRQGQSGRKEESNRGALARRYAVIAFVVIQSAELVFYANRNLETGSMSMQAYEQLYETLQEDQAAINDGGLYRMEREHNGIIRTEAMLAQYNSVSSSSSTNSESVGNLLEKFGFWKSLYGINIEYREDVTAFTDAFWGVKYYCAADSQNHKRYDIKYADENGYILENPNVFPLAFLCGDRIRNIRMDRESTFLLQNDIAEALSEESERIYLPVEYTKIGGHGEDALFYEFQTHAAGTYYLDLFGNVLEGEERAAICVNDAEERIVPVLRYNPICLGFFGQGESVRVRVRRFGDTAVYAENIYYENTQGIANISEKLARQGGNIQMVSSSHFTIYVNATDACHNLLMTIPFDKGWRIYVDGNRTKPGWALDDLLMIPLEAGEHKIEMYYVPRGLAAGACVTLISILVALFLWRRSK